MAKSRRNVRVSFSAEGITHFGGVLLLHRFVQKLQLRRALTRLRARPERNRRYSLGELTLAVLYPILLGLGRLETARLLRYNGVFQQITGLHTYPHPSSLRRFLSRLGAKALPSLIQLHDRLRAQLLVAARASFDLDTTVLTVYGRQQRATPGFNPKKRGRPSFHPLLCFEGGSGLCWEAEWLPGHAHPLPVTLPLLRRALAKLPQAVRSVWLRADAVFYDQKLLRFLEANHVAYTIAVRLSGELKTRLEALTYRRYASGLEAAALRYRPPAWSRARRFVIIRRPVRPEPSQQLHLFILKGYSYEALVTDRELIPLNVWKSYNQRATTELIIRELKEGCAVGKIPRRDWDANRAYFHLVLLAFDLLIGFRQWCLPGEWRSLNIQSLRQRLLCVPAVWARPQGVPTLRFAKSYPYQQTFVQALRRIAQLPIAL
jgi:hypothetical protein